MLIPDAVARLQRKFEPLQHLVPSNTKLLYEFFVEPDEDATSDDGVFLLVALNGHSGYYDVLTELSVHYNIGQSENFDVEKVHQWLGAYLGGERSQFQSHYKYVVEISRSICLET